MPTCALSVLSADSLDQIAVENFDHIFHIPSQPFVFQNSEVGKENRLLSRPTIVSSMSTQPSPSGENTFL